jgi:hypothetical protein
MARLCHRFHTLAQCGRYHVSTVSFCFSNDIYIPRFFGASLHIREECKSENGVWEILCWKTGKTEGHCVNRIYLRPRTRFNRISSGGVLRTGTHVKETLTPVLLGEEIRDRSSSTVQLKRLGIVSVIRQQTGAFSVNGECPVLNWQLWSKIQPASQKQSDICTSVE